jgi:hypothetical protein
VTVFISIFTTQKKTKKYAYLYSVQLLSRMHNIAPHCNLSPADAFGWTQSSHAAYIILHVLKENRRKGGTGHVSFAPLIVGVCNLLYVECEVDPPYVLIPIARERHRHLKAKSVTKMSSFRLGCCVKQIKKEDATLCSPRSFSLEPFGDLTF